MPKNLKTLSILFFSLVFVLVFSVYIVSKTQAYNGSGTVEDPWEVTTCTELQEIQLSLSSHYELVSNIDCTETSTWNAGAGFIPIGSSATPFTGSLDGNGYTISNLYINKATSESGLFGAISAATIQDLTLINVDINASGITGGLTANMIGGTVTNCRATGEISDGGVGASKDYIGGLIAVANGNPQILNSSTNVTISVVEGDFIGGLVGLLGAYTQTATVNDSYAQGNITAGGSDSSSIGGLIGSADDSEINRSYSTGNISLTGSSHNNVGSFVGLSFGTNITDSYSTGDLINNSYVSYVGGFVGMFADNFGGSGSHSILRSHSEGDVVVKGDGSDSIGGFVGFGSGLISDSYSTGNVTVNAGSDLAYEVGGFIGNQHYSEPLSISSSFSYGNVNGLGNIMWGGGFAGELKSNATINESSSFGNISGSEHIGGFVGISQASITNSFSRGSAQGNDYIGGFVGSTGSGSTIDKVYSTGLVSATLTNVGGLIGSHGVGSTTTASYWDVESSGLLTDPIATGYTTVQMKAVESYIGWDFVSTWNLNTSINDGYPNLGLSSSLFAGGTGTALDPYEISTCAQLQNIKYEVASNFELISNVSCTATTGWNNGNGFIPLGTVSTPFIGTLEGNNYSISDLYIHAPVSGDNYGMFAYTNAASISNLNLVNYDITGNNYVGGLIANMVGGTVTNVDVSGDLGATEYGDSVDTGDSVGGLVGVSSANAIISNCSSNVAVHSSRTYSTGGFVGKAGDGTLIENSSSTGTMLIDVYGYGVGNFVGFLDSNSIINDSYSTGSVTVNGRSDNNYSDSFNVAGFVGQTIDSTINRSYSTTSVTVSGVGYDNTGGFVGYSRDSDVTDSYSTGNIVGNLGMLQVGGFAGQIFKSATTGVSLYLRCHATGDISTNGNPQNVGGFVGLASGDVEDSYSTGDITISVTLDDPYADDVGGFIGKSANGNTTVNHIYRSFSLGSINAPGNEESYTTGGFAGSLGKNITIDQCASYGQSTSMNMYVGGFVGLTSSTSSLYPTTITNSFSRTNVNATDLYNYGYVAGFAGSHKISSITNSYSTGVVTSDAPVTYIGGFVGENGATNATVTSSYWDTQTSGIATDPQATGYSTSQMKTQSSFVNWDFDNIWSIDSTTNDGYPHLVFSKTTLTSLAYSVGTISPAFSPTTKSYTITVPTDTTSISLKPTLEHNLGSTTLDGTPIANDQWTGDLALPSNSNVFLIENTSYDTLNTSTYTITVSKGGVSDPDPVEDPDPSNPPVAITDLDPSLSVIDILSGLDATIPSTVFKGTDRIIQLFYGTGLTKKLLAQTVVDLTTSRSWANVRGAVSTVYNESFVSSLSNAPGASSSFTLFVPGFSYDTLIRICNGADSLLAVSYSCANGRTIKYTDEIVTKTSFGTRMYWGLSNITGTGAISFSTRTNILPVILPGDEPFVPDELGEDPVIEDPVETPGDEEIPQDPDEPEEDASESEDGDSLFERIIVIPIRETIRFVSESVSDLYINTLDNLKVANIESTITKGIIVGSFSSLVATYLLAALPLRMEYSLYGIQLISSLFAFGKLSKKNQRYGIVYDSVTKEPISRAIIRVTETTGKLVTTIVTDIYGIFDLNLPTGEYKFNVEATGYSFPSRVIRSTEDLPYKNLYFGGVINHTSDNLLNISIPMDKENTALLKESNASIKNVLATIIRILGILFFIFGFITTLFALGNNPTTWTWIIFVIYIIVIAIYIYLTIGVRNNFGYVKSENGELLSGVEIGLMEQEFDTLYAKRVTDEKGRYRFVVPSGKYQLVLLSNELSLQNFKAEVIEIKKDKVGIIKKNLTVSKA